MTQNLKPIQTVFMGYKFRSRLEARWAVFFQTLGLKWEYEPEGFHTSAGMYLPDFRVQTPQGAAIWYEVKPRDIVSDAKFEAFKSDLVSTGECYGSYVRAALLAGDPVDVLNSNAVFCPRCGFLCEPDCGFSLFQWDHPRLSGYDVSIGCTPCDMETPSGGDHPWLEGVTGIAFYPHKGTIMAASAEWPFRPVMDAANAARSARFEHGEGK